MGSGQINFWFISPGCGIHDVHVEKLQQAGDLLVQRLLMYDPFIRPAHMVGRIATGRPRGSGGLVGRAVRRVVDEYGNPVPVAPYLYSGWHTTADKRRVRAICASNSFTPAEKFLVLWFIGSTPSGMMPVHMTATAIAEEVGMTADSVSRMLRKLARHRIIVKTGQIGRISMYSISPHIAFHGPGVDQREAVKSWNPPDIPGWSDVPPHERWGDM